jgi:corticotropin releasing hormone receptor 1
LAAENASRWCWGNGTWEGYSNYSQCKELRLTPPDAESGVEITTQLYLVGYGLSLSTLIIAVVIYLYYR